MSEPRTEQEAFDELLRLRGQRSFDQLWVLKRVDFAETDLMAIVHHAAYVYLFERARVALLGETRFPYTYWTEKETHLPVLSLSIEYRTPFRFGDMIMTRMEPRLDRARICIHYECWKYDGDLQHDGVYFDLPVPQGKPRTTGESTHVAIDNAGNIKRLRHVLTLFKVD